MTTRFLDSFEHYMDLSQKYEATSGSGASIVSGGGRFATAGVALTSGSSSTGAYLQKNLNAQSKWIVGAAWYPYAQSRATTSSFNSSDIFMGIMDAGGFQVKLVPLSDGRLLLGNSTGILGTSTRTITLGTWQYVEFKVTIDNPGSFEVRVDEETWISGAGNTDPLSSGTANQIRLGSACSPTLDDVYILDGQFNGINYFNSDFLGDTRILSAMPNGDSATTGWTPSSGSTHYVLVDETPPSTTDYVERESNVAGPPPEMFDYPDIDEGLGGVSAVQILAYAQLIEGSGRTLSFKVDAAVSQSGGALSGTDKYLHYAYDHNPTMAPLGIQDPWTAATVNDNAFGVEFT